MNGQLNPDWNDEQIIEYIRHWAIEHGKCGLDSAAVNRVNERHLFPAGKILGDRGPHSLAKLLPLLNDDNPDVRLTAAGIAYDVDKPACRTVLEDLLKRGGVTGLLAWVMLSYKDFDTTPPIDLWGTTSA